MTTATTLPHVKSGQFDLRANGVTLTGHSWTPDEGLAVLGVVQVLHGMAEHSARYVRLGEALASAGFAVYATDHRGHGQTVGPGGTQGFFAARKGWDLVVRDAHEVATHVRHLHPGAPLLVIGHSFGTVIARELAIRYGDELAGMVLSGPPGDPGALGVLGRMIAAVEGRVLGGKHPSKLLDRMTFGSFNAAFRPNRTQFDWLSRDPAEVDAYVADPACGFVSSDAMFADLITGLAAVHTTDRVRKVPASLPVLVLGGSADPVCRQGRVVTEIATCYREVGLTDVTTKIYPDARHEVFNETNRDEVTADVLAWLTAHT